MFDPGRSAHSTSFAELESPAELAGLLNSANDRVVKVGTTVEDEVYRSLTGHAADFASLWGPVRDENGLVELVVDVSRDTSEL